MRRLEPEVETRLRRIAEHVAKRGALAGVVRGRRAKAAAAISRALRRRSALADVNDLALVGVELDQPGEPSGDRLELG